MTLAAVFWKVGSKMQSYYTDRESDVDIEQDIFAAYTSPESRCRGATFHHGMVVS